MIAALVSLVLSALIMIAVCFTGAFLALVAFRARERRLAALEAARLVSVADLTGADGAS